jgi:hypothetical protein
VKKKKVTKRIRQARQNERENFYSMCASYRPLFDFCLSQEGQDVFGKAIPDAVMEHMRGVQRMAGGPMDLAAVSGWAVQTLLVGYAHLLNAVEQSTPGIKKQVVREFLNSIHTKVDRLEGLPAGE